MPESPNYPEDQRHALTTDDRCVLLAEAVKYYAGHIQETISNNWDALCEAIDEELALKKPGQGVLEDRPDLSLSMQKLADARGWADKLAKLPFALGAVSPFSHIVENFWTTVQRGLKSALRELAP